MVVERQNAQVENIIITRVQTLIIFYVYVLEAYLAETLGSETA